jgi:hypothetical protein
MTEGFSQLRTESVRNPFYRCDYSDESRRPGTMRAPTAEREPSAGNVRRKGSEDLMHPYFTTTLAEDHMARLRADAERHAVGRARGAPTWLSRILPFLHGAQHALPPDRGQRAPVEPVRLAPVLVMAPPFPPSARMPTPAVPLTGLSVPTELAS